MRDYGHDETERLISEMEKKVADVYRQSEKELSDKLDDYLKKFETKDAIWQKNVADGKRTLEEYKQWQKGQMLAGYRWQAMRDQVAEDMHNSNAVARSIVMGYRPEAYAINHNFATYQVEKAARVNTGYTLYSRETVERILRDQPELLPAPGASMQKKLHDYKMKTGKDIVWQKGQIQSVMTQAVIQGESIPNISKRIAETLGEMNHKATIRYARTAITGAQNAGRIDAYRRAAEMGIGVKRQWVATIDFRTRHEHRMLDGEIAEVDEPFKVDGYEIMFPGDPAAEPYLIWNCRCTTIPVVDGFSNDYSGRSDDAIQGMSYDDWKESRYEESHSITKQEQIAELMKRRYINELYGGYGGQSGGGVQPRPTVPYSPMGELSDTPYRYEFDDTMYSERQKEHAMQFARRIQTLQEDYLMPDGRALYIGDYHDVQHRLSVTQRARAQSVMDDGSFAVAQCWVNPENDVVIGFNPGFSLGGSFADDVALRNRKIAAGEIIENLYYSPEGVAIHEYGHALADYVTNAMIYDDPDAIGFWEWYKSLSKEDIAKGLSEYAATNKDEFMAEAFAELMMPNPRPLARQYGEYLAKCMESNYKIDEGFTGKGNPVKARFWESLTQNGGG